MTKIERNARLAELLAMEQSEQEAALWEGLPPRDSWSSWDSKPWRHPWLTSKNLRRIRDYSARQRSRWIKAASRLPLGDGKFGLIGNIANNQYMRAKPMRKSGMNVEVVLHPHDNYMMSQPGWEEFSGMFSADTLDYADFVAKGGSLPEVSGVKRPSLESCADVVSSLKSFPHLSPEEVLRWLPFLYGGEIFEVLKEYDSLLCAQIVYLGMLSGRPYIATQCGGDIWYDCSRADLLGQLQIEAYRRASVVFATNPWSFAHARRYGMQHFVYVPLILDDESYSPGPATCREQWEKETGGDFFVFSAVRLNDQVKGTNVAIEGFARFVAKRPGARLVLVGWGQDEQSYPKRFSELGISDKILLVPVAGKKRVIEYLRSADCTLDQFSIGYYGASALEAMACGAPVIMRIEQEQYDALLETGAPPILNASEPFQVTEHLLDLHDDSDARIRIAKAQRNWVVASHGPDAWLPAYSAALRLTAANTRFNYFWSPLGRALGKHEKRYHAVELASAPTFPNYQ